MNKITEWKRILASYTSDRESISSIDRELKRAKETNHPIKLLSRDLNRECLIEEIRMAKKYLKVFIILSNQKNTN